MANNFSFETHFDITISILISWNQPIKNNPPSIKLISMGLLRVQSAALQVAIIVAFAHYISPIKASVDREGKILPEFLTFVRLPFPQAAVASLELQVSFKNTASM